MGPCTPQRHEAAPRMFDTEASDEPGLGAAHSTGAGSRSGSEAGCYRGVPPQLGHAALPGADLQLGGMSAADQALLQSLQPSKLRAKDVAATCARLCARINEFDSFIAAMQRATPAPAPHIEPINPFAGPLLGQGMSSEVRMARWGDRWYACHVRHHFFPSLPACLPRCIDLQYGRRLCASRHRPPLHAPD